MAARKLTLVTLGVMAYISPSLSIIIGVFWLNEEFDFIKFISMIIVWVAIAFFTIGEIRESKTTTCVLNTEKT